MVKGNATLDEHNPNLDEATPTLMKHNPNLDETQPQPWWNTTLYVYVTACIFCNFWEPLGHAPRDVKQDANWFFSHLIRKALVIPHFISLKNELKKPGKKPQHTKPHHTNPPFPPLPSKKNGPNPSPTSGAKNPSPGKGSTFRRGLWWTHDTWVLTTKSLIPSSAILFDDWIWTIKKT